MLVTGQQGITSLAQGLAIRHERVSAVLPPGLQQVKYDPGVASLGFKPQLQKA